MKKDKKILSVMLASVLCLTLFSGCTKEVKRTEWIVDSSVDSHEVAPYFADDDEIIDSNSVDERELTNIQFTMENTVGTDMYGRKVLTYGNEIEDREVGIFFLTWMGMHPEGQTGIYDISELLLNRPDDLYNAKGTKYSPAGKYHLWGEPLYGYYNSCDPWVVDRQVQMLTTMGVDFLGLDATNGVVYTAATKLLLETLQKYQVQGFDVPKIMFFVNTRSVSTTLQIYNEFYNAATRLGDYESLWYRDESGKPNIASNLNEFDGSADCEMLKNYFHIQRSQWPNDKEMEPDAMPWISFQYPQYNHNGTMSVSVAQNVGERMSNPDKSWGRGYDQKTGQNLSEYSREGLNFKTQWETVFQSLDTENPVKRVFVCEYNEWTALKFPDSGEGSDVYFVDLFNEEFSRDIEPMKGGYEDNFYLQMMANLRRYKFEKGKKYILRQTETGDMTNPAMWENVRKYVDFQGDAMKRDYDGFHYSVHYKDDSARNDIVSTQVIHDNTNLYIRIETATDITERAKDDRNFMNIWLGNGSGGGFEDYNYVINRFAGDNNRVSIEVSRGGFNWEKIGEADCRIAGKEMLVKIPLETIGVDPENPSIRFKVSDNVLHPEDIMNFYIEGDCAPMGRLSYCYGV